VRWGAEISGRLAATVGWVGVAGMDEHYKAQVSSGQMSIALRTALFTKRRHISPPAVRDGREERGVR